MKIIAVFRSRAQAVDCVSALRGAGVPARLISTPRETRAGCGVSAEFDGAFFPRVKTVLFRKNYTAFSGFWKVQGGGIRPL